MTKLSLWAPYSPHAQRPHPVLGPALRHLARLRCLWLGGWRLSHADLPPSLQLLKLQVPHPAYQQLLLSCIAYLTPTDAVALTLSESLALANNPAVEQIRCKILTMASGGGIVADVSGSLLRHA